MRTLWIIKATRDSGHRRSNVSILTGSNTANNNSRHNVRERAVTIIQNITAAIVVKDTTATT